MSKRKADAPASTEETSVSSSTRSPSKRNKKGTNTDLNGWWKLDLEKSDNMQKYLGAMRLNDVAIQAALKGERDVATLHKFHITTTSVTIERRSRMGNNITKLVYGKPILKTMSTGEKSMTASKLIGGGFRIDINMPLASGVVKIVDSRTLDEAGNLLQVLTTADAKTGNSTTTRHYLRCPEPPPLPIKPVPPPKPVKKEKVKKKPKE